MLEDARREVSLQKLEEALRNNDRHAVEALLLQGTESLRLNIEGEDDLLGLNLGKIEEVTANIATKGAEAVRCGFGGDVLKTKLDKVKGKVGTDPLVVENIWSLFKEGRTGTQIAKQMNLYPSQVYTIIKKQEVQRGIVRAIPLPQPIAKVPVPTVAPPPAPPPLSPTQFGTPRDYVEKMSHAHQMVDRLAVEWNVQVRAPKMNPATTIGKRNIDVTYTALRNALTSREKLQKLGLETTKKLKLHFGTDLPNVNARAYLRGKKIQINIESGTWKSHEALSAYNQNAYNVNWSSVNTADRIVTHEVGHILHYSRKSYAEAVEEFWPRSFGPTPPALEIIARRVSRYAATNAMEFVAETFTALVEGRRFDSQVMDLYKKLKGPMLKGFGKI